MVSQGSGKGVGTFLTGLLSGWLGGGARRLFWHARIVALARDHAMGKAKKVARPPGTTSERPWARA